ncbi:uncharacterized protein [Salminus brasiliensis]|uniref:uncharacterized protein n=1 Tax=Salminus brasiliensis TaxID=930266 RepID=UPI003B82E392
MFPQPVINSVHPWSYVASQQAAYPPGQPLLVFYGPPPQMNSASQFRQYGFLYFSQAQEYSMASPATSVYPGTNADYSTAYAAAYYTAQPQIQDTVATLPVFMHPALQQQAPPPHQDPPQQEKRERKLIRIRDPHQGGRDVTEEIMSSARALCSPTLPQSAGPDMGDPPQTNGETLLPPAPVMILHHDHVKPVVTSAVATTPAPQSKTPEQVTVALLQSDSAEAGASQSPPCVPVDGPAFSESKHIDSTDAPISPDTLLLKAQEMPDEPPVALMGNEEKLPNPLRFTLSPLEEPRKIITGVLLNSDIKLNTVENAWRPGVKKARGCSASGEQDNSPETLQTQELFRRVHSILNKLTPQKFQPLMKQLTELVIDTEDRMKGVINLVYEKAIAEPNFSETYAKMRHGLIGLKVPTSDNPDVYVSFRKLLLSLCQDECEKHKDDEICERKQMELDAAAEHEERRHLQLDVERARRCSTGNIKFTGELFRLKILAEPIMHPCILKLLKTKDEENLECLCKLLSTIGKELDEKAKSRMDEYFIELEEIKKQRKTSSRIRFMLQDILDLRQHNWVPSRGVQGPKTIAEIHEEAKMEEDREQIKVQQQVLSKKGWTEGSKLRRLHSSGSRISQPQDDESSSVRKSAPAALKVQEAVESPGFRAGSKFCPRPFSEIFILVFPAEHWKPLETKEKRHYEREFLLRLQFNSSSMQKPEGQIPGVVLDKPNKTPLQALDPSCLKNCKTKFTPSFSRQGRHPGGPFWPFPRGQRKELNTKNRSRDIDHLSNITKSGALDSETQLDPGVKGSLGSRVNGSHGGSLAVPATGIEDGSAEAPVAGTPSAPLRVEEEVEVEEEEVPSEEVIMQVKCEAALTPPPAPAKPVISEEEVEKVEAIDEDTRPINYLNEAVKHVQEENTTSQHNGGNSTSTIAREPLCLPLRQLISSAILPNDLYYKGLFFYHCKAVRMGGEKWAFLSFRGK